MKFQKFQPPSIVKEMGVPYIMEASAELSKKLGSRENISQKRLETAIGIATIFNWQHNKQPYYRLYPGVLEALLKLDLSKLLKLQFPPLPFGITTLEVEIPEVYWESMGFKAFIFENVTGTIKAREKLDFDMEIWSVVIQDLYDGINPIPIERSMLNEHALEDASDFEIKFLKLLCGILSIGENPDIVKPICLAKDSRKYLEADEARKAELIDKARRRGVIGFDIGEGIPTKAEIKAMENSQAKKQGGKATHIRAMHLALYWTGTGRQFPVYRVIDTILVNGDKIPHGFYSK